MPANGNATVSGSPVGASALPPLSGSGVGVGGFGVGGFGVGVGSGGVGLGGPVGERRRQLVLALGELGQVVGRQRYRHTLV